MKSTHDVLAEADIEAEQAIIRRIRKSLPGHSILSEEAGVDDIRSPYQWVVDPLDGTVNYVQGIEEYCVSIALTYRREPILGLVFQPVTQKMYYAEKGRGAFCNGKRIHVSSTGTLVSAVLATDNSAKLSAREKNFALLSKLCSRVRHTRIMGSGALHLARVATGQIDVYMKTVFNYWDIAAGIVLVQEAGGQITDIRGKKLSEKSEGVIVSNGLVHTEFLRAIKKAS